MLRLLVDAQLPPALARWSSAQGHQADHVFDLALTDAADTAIWRRALETSAVIVTKDEDFALRAQLHRGGPPIVWIRYGNVRKADLLRRLGAVWPNAGRQSGPSPRRPPGESQPTSRRPELTSVMVRAVAQPPKMRRFHQAVSRPSSSANRPLNAGLSAPGL